MTKVANFKVVAEGTHGSVRLAPEVMDEYKKVLAGTDERSVRQATQIKRHFKEYCENDRPRLNNEQFKKEGDYASGHDKIAVYEFKGWQIRIYGIILSITERRCFVGLKIDRDKKQNKADKQKLTATAEAASNLEEFRVAKAKKSGEGDGQRERRDQKSKGNRSRGHRR